MLIEVMLTLGLWRTKLDGITGIKDAKVNLVFEPEWDKDMMTEEAKLELGFM